MMRRHVFAGAAAAAAWAVAVAGLAMAGAAADVSDVAASEVGEAPVDVQSKPSAEAAKAPVARQGDAPATTPASGTGSSGETGGSSGQAIRTMFVVPFANEAGNERYDPVAAGIGELVEAMMATSGKVRIVDRQKFQAVAAEHALKLKGLTGDAFAIQVGKLMEADTVLCGRLYVAETKLIAGIQALDIATARVAAAEQMACRPEDLLETAAQLARKLAGQLAMPLPEMDLESIDKSPLAGLHFAKALSCYYAGNLDEALMQLMRTIDLDPDCVEAHYWSGLCYQRQREWPHAVIEWEKFLKRRPRGPLAEKTRPLLDEARKLDAETSPPRLVPLEPAEGAGEEAH